MPISIKARIEKSGLLGMSQDFKAARGMGGGAGMFVEIFWNLKFSGGGERIGWFEKGAHVRLDQHCWPR